MHSSRCPSAPGAGTLPSSSSRFPLLIDTHSHEPEDTPSLSSHNRQTPVLTHGKLTTRGPTPGPTSQTPELRARLLFSSSFFNQSHILQLSPSLPTLRQAAEGALNAYKRASESAEKLKTTHPIRLGLALNFSVFHYEVMNDPTTVTLIHGPPRPLFPWGIVLPSFELFSAPSHTPVQSKAPAPPALLPGPSPHEPEGSAAPF